MKISKSTPLGLAAMAAITPSLPASAAVAIEWVTVGNAGNASDATGFGAVTREYRIAHNETTIGQYAEFLNVAAKSDPYSLYSTAMTLGNVNGISQLGTPGNFTYTVTPGSTNRPITYVDWFDAARFCNWLHNGQGNGSTETGAYTLNGAITGIYTVNAGAKVWVPSENEWYKAAFYDPTKDGTGGYWLYANQSNTMSGNSIGVGGAANFFDGDYVGSGSSTFPTGNGLTDVGVYGTDSQSYYGANDMAGNVREWNDSVSGSSRGLRGGAWYLGVDELRSSPTLPLDRQRGFGIGFRVASVPEPSTILLTILFSTAIATRRKR